MLAHLPTLVVCLGAILICVTVLWLVSLYRHDASIIDAFWGLGFVLLGWMAYGLQSAASPRALLLCILTSVWGLRLSIHLLIRNMSHGEDRRYAAMRAWHGANFWWVSFFSVYLLQGALLWFISLPLQISAVIHQQPGIGPLDFVGSVLWLVGLCFETVGDWQLTRFNADPANEQQVLQTGLWRYTRHPNYFGDFCVWWGFYLIAASGGAWWTIGSPLVMSILLMQVSGVTLLESTITHRRPAYVNYQQRTSPFFPWPPRTK